MDKLSIETKFKIETKLKDVKKTSRILPTISFELKQKVLRELAKSLNANLQFILENNQKDLENISIEDPLHDRLLLNDKRIQTIADSLLQVSEMKDPLNITIEEVLRPNGLLLKRKTVPLGVVGMI